MISINSSNEQCSNSSNNITENDINNFWNKNTYSSVYKESNFVTIDELNRKNIPEKKKVESSDSINNETKVFNDALKENCKNESSNIEKLLKSRKIIEDSKNEYGPKDIKYNLPKDKKKEELQEDMKKTYYDNNDMIIFQNNYTIIPITSNENSYNSLQKNVDEIKLNFDEDLKIEEKYIEQLLKMKNLDINTGFYNLYSEREIQNKVQNIVAKVIPEESRHFKTSLPLFDALSAVEKSRSAYINIVDKLNNINDIYEEWIQERERSIILNYQTTVAKYEKSKNDQDCEIFENMLEKEMMQNSVKKEIENLMITNSNLNSKLNELTQELQSN
ncbi:hypothetical protein BCR32DRAFT_289529, partial [Anaeromyces robustus]